ncbi:MAG: hypothetical protein Q7S80_00380 [bacterium]|nr:hypothetical protein [bacterium]
MGEIGTRSVLIAGCPDPRLRRSYEQLANELNGVLKLTPGVRFRLDTFVPDPSNRQEKLTRQAPLVLVFHTECGAYPDGDLGDRQGRDYALWLGLQTRSHGISTAVLQLRRDQSPVFHWLGLNSTDCWLESLIREVIRDDQLDWSYDDEAVVHEVVVGDNFVVGNHRRQSRALLLSAADIDNNLPTVGKILGRYAPAGQKVPMSFARDVPLPHRDKIRALFLRHEMPVFQHGDPVAA